LDAGVLQQRGQLPIIQRESAVQLAHARDRHELLLASLPGGTVIHDASGQLLRANPAAEAILGMTEREMVAASLDSNGWRFLRKDETPMPVAEYPVSRVLATRQPVHDEILGVLRPGADHPVWVQANAIPMLDDDGRIQEVVVSLSDITARFHAERLREESHRLLRGVLDVSEDMIFVKDRELRTVICNEAFARAVGRRPADMIGRTDLENGWAPEFINGDPARGIRGFAADDRAVLRGEKVHNPRDPANVNGETRWFDTYKLPLRNAAGEVIAVVATSRDITEQLKMETQLAESERRLRLALEAARLGMFDWDIPANRIHWSRRHEDLWGFAPGEFPGNYEAFASRLHPEDAPRVEAWVAQCVATGKDFDHEFRVCQPDGTVKWIGAFGRFELDAADQAQRMRGVVQDITARKAAENQMRASETRHRQLIEEMRDAFATVDLQGRIQTANPVFQEMLGYSERELRELTYYDITPACWHGFEDRIRAEQVRVRGYSDVYEKEYRRKDGVLIPVELRTYLLRDAAGEPVGMGAIVREITERKRLEADLRHLNEQLEARVARRTAALGASEARFRLLTEAAHEGVAIVSQGILMDANPRLAAMLGWPLPEMLGQPLAHFIAPEDHPLALNCLNQAQADNFEFHLVCRDGSRILVTGNCRQAAQDNRVIGICTFRDVTAERQAAGDYERLRNDLARFQRLAELNEVHAGILHQVGQPLTAAINNVTVGRQLTRQCDRVDCHVRAVLQDADSQLGQVQRTIQRLRVLAHPERMDLKPGDVASLLEVVSRMFQPEAAGQQFSLELLTAPELPPVAFDEVQITQVLLNLLRNAMDASVSCPPERRVITLHTRSAPSGGLLLTVTDRGVGISPDILPHLFDPFFTTKPTGSGIGLSLARTIMHAHGGTLTPANNPDGPGASFTLEFPPSHPPANP